MLNKITLILLILIPSMQAGRWYDPGVGRFLNQDPIGVDGGINIYNSMSNNMVNGFTGGKTLSAGMQKYAGEIIVNSGVDPYGFGIYELGDNPKPQINWDNGFKYDPNVSATSSDYYQWLKFTTLLSGAEALGHLPDGSRAYRHYRRGRGRDLKIDYVRAYNEDSDIKHGIDLERLDAKDFATTLWDKKTYDKWFSISGTDELVGSATENWQKAIGGHRAWGRGRFKVKCISKTEVEFTVELTIHMEDFYNFNKGQVDIATGLPDDPNGRFEVLGWAQSFFSRGNIENTMTFKVDPSKIKPGVDYQSQDSTNREGRDWQGSTRDRGRRGL